MGPDPNTTVIDSDLTPDYLDLDSDNDGVYDTEEGGNAVLISTVMVLLIAAETYILLVILTWMVF